MPLKESSSLERALRQLEAATPLVRRGRVQEVVGLTLKATLPAARIGDHVLVQRAARSPLAAQVVGFSGEQAILVPLGGLEGIGPESLVEAAGGPLTVRCGPGLLGRVLDGLARPLDGLGPIVAESLWPVRRTPPSAVKTVFSSLRRT